MSNIRIEDAILAYTNGRDMARSMVPGVVFHGAWHYLRAAEIDVDSTYGRLFTDGFLSEIKQMYPRGVPVATIRGIPNTIIPE